MKLTPGTRYRARRACIPND